MDCAETRRFLAEHALAILDPALGTLVEGHLDSCPACRLLAADEASGADAIRADVARDSQRSAPRADVAAILARARRRDAPSPSAPRETSRVPSPLRRFAPLAAALFLAGIGTGAAAMAALSTRGLEGRLRAIERAAPALAERAREEALAALEPVARQFAAALDSGEQRRRLEMEEILRFISRARAEDRAGIAGALRDTREDLALTQDAVVRVAAQVPPWR